MTAGRERLAQPDVSARTARRVARRRGALPDHVLALQRRAGNRATRRFLGRDAKPAPTFKIIVANDGKTGLDDALVKLALDSVRKELARITKDSTDDAVRAGFDIEHVAQPPPRSDEFTSALGRKTFLVILTPGRDAKHAVELVWQYIPLTPEERAQQEQRFRKGVATEGGVDIQMVGSRRRSQSVGFVGTEGPLAELDKPRGGRDSAAAALAEVILHELGHAFGHNKELGPIDHDESGIMTAKIVMDAGPYKLRQFSSTSAQIIRSRLEELAKRLAR